MFNAKDEFEKLIDATLQNLGGELDETKEVLAAYGAERSQRLAEILERNEPGFDQALTAARDNMALKAGLKLGADAAAVDREWLGLFAGGLRFAAAALAAL